MASKREGVDLSQSVVKKRRCDMEKCTQFGCEKLTARGLCSHHRKCLEPGCTTRTKHPTKHCIKHGGGLRCQTVDCKKAAQYPSDRCVAHGGGYRCTESDCKKTARKQGPCPSHGGPSQNGSRIKCREPGCIKYAQHSDYCIVHGGGYRCTEPDCKRNSRKRGPCSAHGGANQKRVPCSEPDCKSLGRCSVHRCTKPMKKCEWSTCNKRTSHGFCYRHKKCQTPNCTNLAKSPTDYCIKHGNAAVKNKCTKQDTKCSNTAVLELELIEPECTNFD